MMGIASLHPSYALDHPLEPVIGLAEGETRWRAMTAGGAVTFRSPTHNEDQKSSGQGSTIFQRSMPFLIFFISVVSPPLRRIQSFTVSG